jgi:hypothetical protein
VSRIGRRSLSADQLLDLELHLRRDDLEARVRRFARRSISLGVATARSQSYDHCYNYFADTKDPVAELEKSCAILGFYLASWGMYRGSTYLQQETNSSHLVPAIRAIQTLRPTLAGIDLNNYSEGNIELVLSAYGAIKDALQIRQRSQVTIVTKVMVAAFGCIPAFDRNFSQAFRRALQPHARLPHGRVDSDVLRMLAAFYRANRDDIEKLHQESRTVAFGTDTVTGHRLSRAKIVDMYFYELGAN